MWQYTSDGTVNGYNGRLDMNYCYRDYVSEISSRGGNPVIEQKEDEKMIAELQAQVNQLQEQINNKNNEISNANAEVQRLNNLLTDTREELSQTKFDKNILSTEVAKAIKALEEERKNKPLSGDFNDDGVVNTLDSLGILNHIAKM